MANFLSNFLGGVGHAVQNIVHPQQPQQNPYNLGNFLQQHLGQATQAVANPVGFATQQVARAVPNIKLPTKTPVTLGDVGNQIVGPQGSVARVANYTPVVQGIVPVARGIDQLFNAHAQNQAASQALNQNNQAADTFMKQYQAGKITQARLKTLLGGLQSNSQNAVNTYKEQIAKAPSGQQAAGGLANLGLSAVAAATAPSLHGASLPIRSLAGAATGGTFGAANVAQQTRAATGKQYAIGAGTGAAVGAVTPVVTDAIKNALTVDNPTKLAYLNKIGESAPAAETPQAPVQTPQLSPDELQSALSKLGYDENKQAMFTPEQLQEIANKQTPANVSLASTAPQDTFQQSEPLQAPEGQKVRQFAQTLSNSPNSSDAIKTMANRSPDSFYTPITNQATLDEAKNFVNANPDAAIAEVLDPTKKFATAMDSTKAQVVMQNLQNQGRYDEAAAVANASVQKATEAGQAVQALSIWDRMSPDMILYTATKSAGGQLPDETAQSLLEQAAKAQNLEPGQEKDVATATLIKQVNDLNSNPSSRGQQAAALQRIAQLLNLKTITRKVISETALNAGENAASVPGSAYDKLLSAITGNPRTVGTPNMGTEFSSFIEGARNQIEDTSLGINTAPGQTGEAYGLPPRYIFDNPVLQTAEKTQDFAFRLPTRAFWQASYDNSIQNQIQLNGVDQPTDDMVKIAQNTADNATLQNASLPAKMLSQFKSMLNQGKAFGVGNVIDNYPKVPGNLIDKAVDYSPLGLINPTVIAPLRAAINQQGIDAITQNELSMQFGRGVVGTLGAAGAYELAKLGIITGKADSSKKAAGLQLNNGQHPYEFNMSGASRFLQGKSPALQAGDKLANFDWLEPFSPTIAAMANAVNTQTTKQKALGIGKNFLDQMMSGLDTMGDQPVFQGISQFLSAPKGQTVSTTLNNIAVDLPASFVPTILNQTRQAIDPNVRNVYTGSTVDKSLKAVENKIPGLSTRLEPKIDNFGQPETYRQPEYQNFLNIFMNPAKPSTYNPDSIEQNVIDLYKRTGETKQIPGILTKVPVNGKDVTLTDKQQTQLQSYVGGTAHDVFGRVMQDPRFTALDDTQKVNTLTSLLTSIKAAGQAQLFGGDTTKLSKGAQALLNGQDLLSVANIGPKVAAVKAPKVAKPKTVKIASARKAAKPKLPKFGKIALGKIPTFKAPRIAKAKTTRVPGLAKASSKKLKVIA